MNEKEIMTVKQVDKYLQMDEYIISALLPIHNHPRGEPQSRQHDIDITNRIISACELVGIKVLNHIIIDDNNYFSFFNEGMIKDEGK